MLSEELAGLQAELAGKPVTPAEILLVASRTDQAKAFATPAGGKPAWRVATLDHLRAQALELRERAAQAAPAARGDRGRDA